MPVPPRSEGEVGRSLRAVVTWRWPRERLLLTTRCHVERLAGRAEWFLSFLGRMHCPGGACVVDTTHRDEEAFAAVTGRRLLYQERARHGMFLRIAALFLLGVAVISLLATRNLTGPLLVAGFAAASWLGGGLARALGVGSGNVEFRRVARVDRRAQLLEGLGRWGTRYRVLIPDPSDFRFIATIVEREAAT